MKYISKFQKVVKKKFLLVWLVFEITSFCAPMYVDLVVLNLGSFQMKNSE